MKKLLCLLFAALLLCVSASALELPSELDGTVPRELIDNAETGNDLLLRGGQYLFSHFRAALQDAVANSLRGAMALMLLSLLCGLVESTAENVGETPTRYAGYLGVLGAAALSAGDLSALIGLGVETMDELSVMAKLLLPTIAAAMAGGGCVGSASVWQVGALMLSDIFLSLMRDVLVPVLYCMIGTAAAGALLEQSRLSLLSKGIGKLLSWGLSAILIVFTAFLSVSNLLAGSADRLAVKVGKTVISGAVPIVGGILSDATEAVAAAALTLRARSKTAAILSGGIDDIPLSRASRITNYPGCPDVSGRALLEAMEDQALDAGAEILHGRATSIAPLGDGFGVIYGADFCETETVILCTGIAAGKVFPGERELLGRGVSYCVTCDGMLYRGKKVCVVGFTSDTKEEAELLRTMGCEVEMFTSRTAKYAVLGQERVTALSVNGEEHPCEAVFILRPAAAPDTLLAGLAMDGVHVAVDKATMKTSVAGVFAAGDCTGKPYQIAKAVGDGNIAAQYIEERSREKKA